MKEKVIKILQKIYGILMSVSFFGGFLPLIPFIFALIIGGDLAEKICLFLKNQYYPVVIIAGSVAIIVGLVATYIGKLDPMTNKKSKKTKDEEGK